MQDGRVYTTILIIVDRYSKINVYILTDKTCIAITLAKMLVEEIVRHYRVLAGSISNRGLLFTS